MTKAALIPPTAISRAVVVLLILIVVKVAVVVARGPAPIERDAKQYWDLSSQVMAGDPWLVGVPIAYRTPMYPWFLAVIRTLGGPFELPAVVLAQAIAAVSSVAFAARLAWLLTESKRAVAVTLLCLLPSISAMTYVPVMLTETLFTTLWMANLVAVASYAKRPTLSSATLAAITYAVCLLTRPIVLLAFVPHLVLVWMVTRGRRSSHTTRARGHRLVGTDSEANLNGNSSEGKTSGSIRNHGSIRRHAVVAIGIVALMVGPWLVRNRQLFGETFLTEFLGRNVWIVTFQQGPSVAGFELPDSPAGDELRRRIEPLSTAPTREDALPAGDEDWRHTWTVSNQLVRSGLDDAGISGEVVVADNGSDDDSAPLATAAGARVVPVTTRGYGASLMKGIESSHGTFVIMGDADDSYDFLAIPRFIERLREGYDLVQGCRLPIAECRVAEGRSSPARCRRSTAGSATRCCRGSCGECSGFRSTTCTVECAASAATSTTDSICGPPEWNSRRK